MKKNLSYLLFLVLLCVALNSLYNIFLNYKYSLKAAQQANLEVDVNHGLNDQLSLDGIQNIALLTMVKDEDDIIYENLRWHFALGFRKFIIVDNNSTDNTKILIEKFEEETKSVAKVFIIKDPIVEYIQSSIMTGSYLFAKTIWKDIKWVLPIDADEFLRPQRSLVDILNSIPSYVDAIICPVVRYRSLVGDIIKNGKFYDNISHRENRISSGIGKVIFRNTDKTFSIAQGNHSLETSASPLLSKKLKIFGGVRYIGGGNLGLIITEYHVRSPQQAHKKYMNGMQANISGQNSKLVKKGDGTHWTNFQHDLAQYGEEAGTKKFNEMLVDDKSTVIYDPIPIQRAFDVFNKKSANQKT